MNAERLLGNIRQLDLDSSTGRVRVINAGNQVSVRFDCPLIDVKTAFRRWHHSVFIGRWVVDEDEDVFMVLRIEPPELTTVRDDDPTEKANPGFKWEGK